MSLLDQVIAADAVAYTDPDLMPECESVVWTDADGTTRTINVNVNRHQPQMIAGMEVATMPVTEVFVQRHATLGATSITLQKNAVTLQRFKGVGTAEERRVTEIVSEDAGGFLLRLS